MKEDILFEEIKNILIHKFEIDEKKIEKQSSFYFDLELDSLDMVDLTLFLENKINKTINSKRLKDIDQIKDLICLIQKL